MHSLQRVRRTTRIERIIRGRKKSLWYRLQSKCKVFTRYILLLVCRLRDEVSGQSKPPTARSYRGTLIDDNMVFSFNIKWLGQIIVLAGMLVYGYWNIISRIETLENGMAESNTQIAELVSKHIADEQVRYKKMEQEIEWYKKELNLNPLSWRKKKKK